MNPKHANTLYNYAVMLDTHLKRKEEAEAIYRSCLQCEPKHAFALYNLAVLLEERLFSSAHSASTSNAALKQLQQRKEEVGQLYKKAVEADPRDASTLADYGRFLLVRMDEAVKGRQALQAALKMNPSCEIALYHLAVIQHRQEPPDLTAAADMLKALISVAPQHANGHLQLARVLSDLYRKELTSIATEREGGGTEKEKARLERAFTEICRHYEKAMTAMREPGDAALEYLKLAAAYGNVFHKRRIVELCSMAVNSGLSSSAAVQAAGVLSPAADADLRALQMAKVWIEKINSTLLSEQTES